MRRSLAKALLWRAFAMGNALTMIALLFGKNLDVAIFTAMVHFDGGESKLNIIDSSVFEQPPIKQHGNDNKDAPSLPSGQQLLVDIKNVDYQFLSSGVQIAKAMAYLLEEFPDARPLSSHCHSLVHVGEGVSCFVLSSDGHISVRSWPAEGVIIVDLFIRGASTLSIPVLLLAIKRLFAIASLDSEDECSDVHLAEPKILWSHKLRGFREGFSPGYRRYGNPLETDVGLDTLRMHYLDKKEVLTSRTTKFQHVDIYEVINPRVNSLAWYERSLSDNGSYESIHPEMYRPDRVLYLDGVQQSSLYGDAAYHEALVHPSMIAHPNPQRVAIIGGGEGATLREVLKHNTVKKVVMIEIDEELVALCREYLPEWSNCADLVGSDATSCFDDSRVTVSFEDAFAWFVKNFGSGKNRREQFDIIIMDALDPDHYVEIVGALYNNDQFVHSLYHGLTEEGVVSFWCYSYRQSFRTPSFKIKRFRIHSLWFRWVRQVKVTIQALR
jgi:spermidine synthase